MKGETFGDFAKPKIKSNNVGGIHIMENLKQKAINAISKMPDSVDIEEIMYRLYVIDKVRKGRKAVEQGDTISIEELKKEIESW